ncbi:hypothetical protein Cyrtocomes_00852 [Candidatus Cyrtobacter comes]|uniref:Uncharacterized protein n=1 Tax=Candidatus Cyrtobacter comes TaxID=675776 RepID=A0ABU5L8L9_9RICK|nr:hypothetical protein [Candidatus Cyrtobacter comes]MDZ5762468.1 hypothetical protein [Candidatus Cyrtobacter comes]
MQRILDEVIYKRGDKDLSGYMGISKLSCLKCYTVEFLPPTAYINIAGTKTYHTLWVQPNFIGIKEDDFIIAIEQQRNKIIAITDRVIVYDMPPFEDAAKEKDASSNMQDKPVVWSSMVKSGTPLSKDWWQKN